MCCPQFLLLQLQFFPASEILNENLAYVSIMITFTHLLYATLRNRSMGLILVYSTRVVVFPVPEQTIKKSINEIIIIIKMCI